MGNILSNFTDDNDITDTTKLKPASVRQIIDYIATHYILTMDFNSLKKLYDLEYCDKLVILTSDIIERYFTDIQITYLAQNIKDGDSSNNDQISVEKDKMIFFNKDDIPKLDIKDPIKKKRVCIGIAKFYIKIAHVFATILTTINPVYVYKDENGKTVKADVYNRNKIPEDAKVKILKLNICDNRINALKRGSNIKFTGDEDENEIIEIHPKICSFNLHLRDTDDLKDLGDEPGIPELMELYYDDNYDYETGQFTAMKESTREIFNENLRNFYTVFTDGKVMPENYTKFSDIKLRDYHNRDECKGSRPKLNRKVKGTLSDDLFSQYAENIKQMVKRANKNQELLLDVLNKLFVYMTDPRTNKKVIRINPDLTEETLQEVIVETRAIIINLYLTCETDFVNGVKIYEAIVDKQILETYQRQIDTLEKSSDHLISDDEIPLPAEIDELENIANKKIQKQKNEVVKKETKIKEEQMKLDFISKPRQSNPLVNVNINVGELYNDKNLKDQEILNTNKPNTAVEPIKGGKHKTQKNTTRRK
jgi:hypothetical protein